MERTVGARDLSALPNRAPSGAPSAAVPAPTLSSSRHQQHSPQNKTATLALARTMAPTRRMAILMRETIPTILPERVVPPRRIKAKVRETIPTSLPGTVIQIRRIISRTQNQTPPAMARAHQAPGLIRQGWEAATAGHCPRECGRWHPCGISPYSEWVWYLEELSPLLASC